MSFLHRPKRLDSCSGVPIAIAIMALWLVLPSSAWAEEVLQIGASAQFDVDPARKPKKFPDLRVTVELPSIFDPGEVDSLFCKFQAQELVDDSLPGVPKVRGRWRSVLQVLDPMTSTFETVKIDSGKFKTGETGVDVFLFGIPTDLFPDGFESGDVSVWWSTEFEPKKGPKTTHTTALCFASMSEGSN